MVKVEFFTEREDGVKLFRTSSDKNVKIKKVGTDEIYNEAIDVEDSGYTYEETDTPIGSEIDEDVEDVLDDE